MDYRVLGRSTLSVSTICMGCWAIAGDQVWGKQDENEAVAALHTAVEVGVNFFDSAEAYGAGRSEELLGRAFQDCRQDVIIATKASGDHMRPEDLRKACEASLRRLQTDYIDVYYMHWPAWDVPFEDTLTEMARLKDEGKVRFVGCSNFGKQDLEAVLKIDHIEINELAYNLLFRAIEYEIVPMCLKHGVSVAPYSPLLHGILTGKFATLDDIPNERARTRHFSSLRRPMTRHGGPGAEAETAAAFVQIRKICDDAGLPMTNVALAWLLRQPAVTTVIAGARSPEQVRANALAVELVLSDDIVTALTVATEPLKTAFGTNADMWENERNTRMR
ncbi:MAG: aldo/keto reductase [Anaerolineae bacterium]|nr:aldo/keto reductase [Anaerolineae bacterium]